MKKYILCAMALCATLGFTSCNDDNDQLTDSRVTYYMTFEMQGDEEVFLNVGDTYQDAGVIATMNGEDVTNQVQVSSDVDTSQLGVYHVTYSGVNADGFTSSATRTVYVGIPLTGTVNKDTSFRLRQGATRSYAKNEELFMLTDGKGLYYIEDLLGGWYYKGSNNYGVNYSAPAYIQVGDDNTVSLVSGGNVAGWGDAVDNVTGKYDAENNTLNVVTTYAGMDFSIDLSLD